MRILVIFLLIFINSSVLSQSIIPAPPSGSGSVGGFGASSNLYTGTPLVVEPLVSLGHPNGSSVPVALSYRSGGHKVQDIAGPVGLGWNLSAGGMITRVVKGLPDTENNFWSPSDSYLDLTNGVKDGEHDDFYFSYPGGGGLFQVGNNGTDIYLMPYQEVKISKSGNFSDCSWVITDAYGTKYYYGETTTSRESTITTKEKIQNGVTVSLPGVTYVSSWYLTKIEFASHSDGYTFSYFQGSNYTYDLYYASSSTECNSDVFPVNQTVEIITHVTISGPKYLSSISSPLGSIAFTWSSNRLDLNMRYLSSVKLQNTDNLVTDHYALNYFYFDASDSWYFGYRYDQGNTCTDALCKRLALGSIDKYTSGFKQAYKVFSYHNNLVGANGGNKHSLPPRNSSSYDHWGFFNGFSDSYAGLAMNLSTRTLNIAAKNAALDFPKACTLKSIEDKISGITTVLNYAENIQTVTAGGLRLTSVQVTNGSQTMTESYTYESPTTPGIPTYFSVIQNGSCETKSLNSSSSTVLFDQSNNHIGFSKVTKTNFDQSKEVYYFTSFADHDDTDAIANTYGAQSSKIKQIPDLGFVTTKFWERGLTDNYEAINLQNSSNPYLSVDNGYQFFYSGSSLNNFYILDLSSGDQKYISYHYQSVSKPITLTSQVTTKNESGTTSTSTTTFNYQSASHPALLSWKETVYQDGSKYRSLFTYPFDVWSSAPTGSSTAEALAYWTMTGKNMIAQPIQTVNMFMPSGSTFKVVGSGFVTFQNNSGLIVPYRRFGIELEDQSTVAPISINTSGSTATLSYDSRYYLVGTHNYLSSGNLSYVLNKDLRTDYTWGYNNSLVTQENTNGFTTLYEHIPLVGVSKVTDPNGRVTTYEYDPFNRLRMVRDHENNIVERYRYHYASEGNPAISSTIGVSGYPLINTAQTFTSNNAASFYGKTRYIWDFGNGVTQETSTNTTTYTYSTAGNYRVSVTLLNPEYSEPFQDVIYRNIFSSLNFAPEVCSNIVSWDRCNKRLVLEPCGPGMPVPPPLSGGGASGCASGCGSTYTCTNSAPDVTFYVSGTGNHCGSLTYDYEYSYNNTDWTDLPISDMIPSSWQTQERTYYIRCKVTDACNQTYTSNTFVYTVTQAPCCGG